MKLTYIIFALVIIILVLFLYLSYKSYEPFNGEPNPNRLTYLPKKLFVINLDKNKDRYNKFKSNYSNTDLANIKCNRFSAINGKQLKPEDYLSEFALHELHEVERNGYRTKHYQLTRGGIGCFLSHLELAKQLVNDKETDTYLIFEDDVDFHPKCGELINNALKNAPNDWDMYMFGYIRLIEDMHKDNIIIPYAFWGMQCYAINKKGARKLIDEVEKTRIDGQIDSYLSVLEQQNKINIYLTREKIISSKSNTTDIQIELRPMNNINPFLYKGYLV